MSERSAEQLQQDLKDFIKLVLAHKEEKGFNANQLIYVMANVLGALAAAHEFKASQVIGWFQKSHTDHFRALFKAGAFSEATMERLRTLGLKELLDAEEPR